MDNVGVSVGLKVEVELLDTRSDVEGEGAGEGDSVVDGDTDHDAVVEVEGVLLELSVPTGLPDALALELDEGEQE